MDKCFVIQPFDGDMFDRLYNEVFSKAIESSGLRPYRVDQDPGVKIPIEDIGRGIEDSKICFAEITTDNPNVWYELGYALAKDKDVVLVCKENERAGKFPFDVQHRNIITYSGNTPSDFQKLESEITKRIKALLERKITTAKIIATPIAESNGLKSHEISLMVILLGQQMVDDQYIYINNITSDMNRAGFTDAAVSLAIRNLKKNGLIETTLESGQYDDEPVCLCRLTKNGEDWLLKNQREVQMKYEDAKSFDDVIDEADIPF